MAGALRWPLAYDAAGELVTPAEAEQRQLAQQNLNGSRRTPRPEYFFHVAGGQSLKLALRSARPARATTERTTPDDQKGNDSKCEEGKGEGGRRAHFAVVRSAANGQLEDLYCAGGMSTWHLLWQCFAAPACREVCSGEGVAAGRGSAGGRRADIR